MIILNLLANKKKGRAEERTGVEWLPQRSCNRTYDSISTVMSVYLF